jgi:hypothetical protein
LKARAQRIHQVHFLLQLLDLYRRNLLSSLLALDQVSKRILISVLEFFRLEVPDHRLDDVAREIEHLLRRVFLWDVVKVALRFSHLVGIVKQQANNAAVDGRSM